MKKLYPYIFPAIALAFLVFLTYRWYALRTQRDGLVTPFEEGVIVENLSTDDAQKILKGMGDLKTVELTSEKSDTKTPVIGQVRYEVKNSKVNFSVQADLPKLKTGSYQVWLKEVGTEAKKKAFVLEFGKGGYMGTASVAESSLPFEVVVTNQSADSAVMGEVILSGRINKN